MQHTADAGNISVWSDLVDDWTSHDPMTRNARVMSGAIDTHYPTR